MAKNRLAHNMIANLLSFAFNLGVSFFLSPYIVGHLGGEAYGFVSLINNFLQTSQIVTIAFNSMGARFITIALHQDQEEKAKQYFSSLFYANLTVAAIILLVCLGVASNVQSVFHVPDELVRDVSWSFMVSGVAFALAMTFSVYTVSSYAKNRLDLSAWRDMIKQLLRAVVIFVLFVAFKPSIVYVSIASLVMELYYIAANRTITRKLLPDFRVQRSYFSFAALKELISSGIWNSIGRLSYTLLNDLDLMVANLFVSAAAMGQLSIAKTVPSAINSLVTTIVAVFLPTYTIRYAKKDIDGLMKEMRKGIVTVGILIAPFLCFLIAFGEDFYRLWQPTQDAGKLQLLSVLSILPLYFTLGMKSVNNVFSITNNLKKSTLATFITSLVTVCIEFLLLKYTSLGAIAIAATSSVCLIIKEVTFIPIYAAKCLSRRWTVFYPQVLKEICIVAISIIVSVVLHRFVVVDSWLSLILYGGIVSLIILILNCVLLLRKQDYDKLCNYVKTKIHK